LPLRARALHFRARTPLVIINLKQIPALVRSSTRCPLTWRTSLPSVAPYVLALCIPACTRVHAPGTSASAPPGCAARRKTRIPIPSTSSGGFRGSSSRIARARRSTARSVALDPRRTRTSRRSATATHSRESATRMRSSRYSSGLFAPLALYLTAKLPLPRGASYSARFRKYTLRRAFCSSRASVYASNSGHACRVTSEAPASGTAPDV